MHRDTDGVVVGVEGEIDIATAPMLRNAVRDAMTDPSARVVVDLERVAFIDSTGVACLLAAHGAAVDRGTALVVRGAKPNVALVFELLGLTDELNFELRPAVRD